MENDIRKVIYTNEPHYDAGLFDNSEGEWATQKAEHEGIFQSWSSETRIGALGQQEVITIGIIEDIESHQIVRIPQNRIRFI